MSPIAYRSRALGPLRAIDWAIPAVVSVVVGPNRVGKSTLLRLPELISKMIVFGPHEAFKQLFDGVPQRHLGVPPSTPMTLGLAGDRCEWELDLTVKGGQIASFPSERLLVDGEVVLWRSFGSEDIESKDGRHPVTGVIPSLALAHATRISPELADVIEAFPSLKHLRSDVPGVHATASQLMLFGMVIGGVLVYSYCTYDYAINHLLSYGSRHSSEVKLLPTGENLFPLLRNWRDDPKLEERYEFVLSTMREIFPHLSCIGFETAGQRITMKVSDRRWQGDTTIPIARESTGFITALLQLCALASCPRGCGVTLDEIETSLHPRAVRMLVEAARRWAAKHDLRVVLATQSQTVLDQFRDDPSKVFVFEPQQETSPKALTELFSPEYLSQFSLGDLFAHLEFGGDTNHRVVPCFATCKASGGPYSEG
jgi:hypothetical protein